MGELERINRDMLRIGGNMLLPYDDFYMFMIDLADGDATRITKNQAIGIRDFLQQWINEDD